MKSLALFPVVLAIGCALTPAAIAECRFRMADTPICMGYLGSRNAATAWHNYGFDITATKPDYVRQLLHESHCIVLSEQIPPGFSLDRFPPLHEMARGKVPLPDGYVEVSRLMMMAGPHSMFYVATNYLEGACERYVPPVN